MSIYIRIFRRENPLMNIALSEMVVTHVTTLCSQLFYYIFSIVLGRFMIGKDESRLDHRSVGTIFIYGI